MSNLKVSPAFSRFTNSFSISIIDGSKEDVYFANTSNEIEAIALEKAGVVISYNQDDNESWEIPEKNQIDVF